MAVSLTDLEYSPDGAVDGAYRVRHIHRVNGWLGAVEFFDGVAENVRGSALRHLVAAAGPELASVERMDANAHETNAEEQIAKEKALAAMPTAKLREMETDAEEQLAKERQAAKDATREGNQATLERGRRALEEHEASTKKGRKR